MCGRGTEKGNLIWKSILKFYINVFWHQCPQNWKVVGCVLSRPGLMATAKAMLVFDSDPLTTPRFFSKKCSKNAKSNPIFHWKGSGDEVLILTYLDLLMTQFLLQLFLPSSILGLFRWKWGVKVGPKKQTLGLSRFYKNSNFWKIIQTVFLSGNILSLVKFLAKLNHIWGS